MDALALTATVLTAITRTTKNPKMPVQQLMILLRVMGGEVPMGDLMKLAGIEQSSVSRNVALLGHGMNPREPGYGLVEAHEDPFYRRRKLVRLTPRGEALKAELERIGL